VRGVPLWASLVALVEDDRVVAGAAVFPALGERVAAARGLGCRWNDTPCGVSTLARLDQALVLTTDERFRSAPRRRPGWQRLADDAALARTWGDAYGYLMVATGRAEAMMDGTMQPWDAAPFEVIVEEAGGVFTGWDGGSGVFGGSSVATNAALATAVRERLAARAEDAR
jgi:fructose-1,6-bisphosphatase/inositol monophosphatase family enzyme